MFRLPLTIKQVVVLVFFAISVFPQWLSAQEQKSDGWFDDLTKGVEEILSDTKKTIKPKETFQEGLQFFREMEEEYTKQLKTRTIMHGPEDERTMAFIANLQQPVDKADSPLFPVGAFIYSKPDMWGETDFTLITAIVFNRIDFSTPITNDLEILYGAEMQYGIAGSTIYHEGIEQKSATYEANSGLAEIKLAYTPGELLEINFGAKYKAKQYHLKNDTIIIAPDETMDNPFRLPNNHSDRAIFLGGQYGDLVTNLKFVLDETMPLDGYALRYRFSYHDRTNWEKWDDATMSSANYQKRRVYFLKEVDFHFHIPVMELSELNLQGYYGKVDNVDRENAFRLGGLGDIEQYRKPVHGYYDKEFYTEEFLLLNARFTLGVNEDNRFLLYYDHLLLRDNELLVSNEYDEGKIRAKRGVGIAYLVSFLDSQQLKLDLGYGFDAVRRNKNETDENGEIKEAFANKKASKGGTVVTLHYQAWF